MALYLVASPIGNLADLSERAITTLRDADLIAAEDTRHTGKLLAHLGLRKPLVAFYDAVERDRLERILRALESGQSVALISDAGTPAVSDPGYRLVRAALDAGHRVVPIPGPSAVLAALVASGLPTDSFRFTGFVPRKAGQRDAFVESLVNETATTVVFESPKRLAKTLDALTARLPDRQVVVARELTKLYEELLRGTARELAAVLEDRGGVKGEVTLVIAGTTAVESATEQQIGQYVDVLRRHGLKPRTVRAVVSELLGVPKKAVFASAEAGKEED